MVWPDDCTVLPAPERPAEAGYLVGADTHHWQIATFEHLARCKQLLLDHAAQEGYSHVFLVDSDLLLEPTTLQVLHSCQVPVVSGVFWTQWDPGSPPLPQCWLAHPYGLEGLGMQGWEYMQELQGHQLVRVLGGGACCLIDTKILQNVGYHPRLTLPMEGMWQGEDRTFAILCQHAHVRQYADAWPRIYHAYRPADRQPANLQAQWEALNAPRQLYAKDGDWVAIRLTPAEDYKLDEQLDPTIRNTRGRLGKLAMAPELEAALRDMRVGERRIVNVTFKEGHPVYPPGTPRAILVELVDVRPN